MQAFKLVNAGFVDKVIIFNSLPDYLTKNIQTRGTDGFPRAWPRFLADIGSTRKVYKTEDSVDLARNWTTKKTPIGDEPCFYVLHYTDINADKEAWRAICDYLRATVGPEVRLKEKIEDMAVVLASDPTQPLSIDPEDIPVVPVKIKKEAPVAETVEQGEVILVNEAAPKRRGRPKKVAVEA